MTAKRECRLRLQKDESISYYVHTCTTFLDLSRERRDRVYSQVLVSPSPITVCSMTVDSYEQHGLMARMNPDYFVDDEGRTIHEDKYIIASKAAVLRSSSFGLLRTSKTIAREAAFVFTGRIPFISGGRKSGTHFLAGLI